MKYIHYIFMHALLIQATFIQSAQFPPVSFCEKLSMRCDLLVAKCCGYTEQDVLVDAAHLPDPRRLEICLALGIGSLKKKDSQGHTALSAARLVDAQKSIVIIKQELKKEKQKEQEEQGSMSPISVTDIKIFNTKID